MISYYEKERNGLKRLKEKSKSMRKIQEPGHEVRTHDK